MKKFLALAAFVVAAGVSVGVASPAAGSAASHRSGSLHVTKECSAYTGLAGSYCTITSSSLKAIKAGSRIVYARAAGATGLDSDVVLYTGGRNSAFGHCALAFATGTGLCTFSGGTGKFKKFRARVAVSFDPTTGQWIWDGTYSFRRSC